MLRFIFISVLGMRLNGVTSINNPVRIKAFQFQRESENENIHSTFSGLVVEIPNPKFTLLSRESQNFTETYRENSVASFLTAHVLMTDRTTTAITVHI